MFYLSVIKGAVGSVTSFRGTYNCKVDTKGRITFPAQYRRLITDEDKSSFVIRLGEYGRVLQLYTDSTFSKVEEERLASLDYSESGVEARRRFYLSVESIQLDANDRLLIPRKKLDDIGADKDITLLGMGPYIEVWAAEEFASRYGEGGGQLGREKR